MNNQKLAVKENLTSHGLNRILHIVSCALVEDKIQQEIETDIRKAFNITTLPDTLKKLEQAVLDKMEQEKDREGKDE